MIKHKKPRPIGVTQDKKGWLDKVQEKALSRKMLVFLTATVTFLFGKLTSSDWVMVAMVYLGTTAALDFLDLLGKNKLSLAPLLTAESTTTSSTTTASTTTAGAAATTTTTVAAGTDDPRPSEEEGGDGGP